MARHGGNAHDNPTAARQGAQCGNGGRGFVARCAKAVVKSSDAVFLRAVRRLPSHPLKTSV